MRPRDPLSMVDIGGPVGPWTNGRPGSRATDRIHGSLAMQEVRPSHLLAQGLVGTEAQEGGVTQTAVWRPFHERALRALGRAAWGSLAAPRPTPPSTGGSRVLPIAGPLRRPVVAAVTRVLPWRAGSAFWQRKHIRVATGKPARSGGKQYQSRGRPDRGRSR